MVVIVDSEDQGRRKCALEGVERHVISHRLLLCVTLTEQVSKRPIDHREPLDKPLVEVSEAKEALQILNSPQGLLVLYRFNLLRVYLNATRGDDKSKVFRAGGLKLALYDVDFQPSVKEPLNNFTDVRVVLRGVCRVDQYVVKVSHISDIKEVKQRVVNKVLETCGCVIKTKQHYQGFEQAKAGDKGGFLLVALSNLEFIKGGDNVKLYKDLSLTYSVKGLLDKRDQVVVLNSNAI